MNEKQLVLQRLNDDEQAKDYSSEVIGYMAEHAQEFNFAHAQAGMMRDEFENYRSRTIQEAISFFEGLGR